MQCVLDNDISDKYFKEGVIHFKEKFNLKLDIFPANTPDTLSPELRFAHFKTSTKNRKLKQQCKKDTDRFYENEDWQLYPFSKITMEQWGFDLVKEVVDVG